VIVFDGAMGTSDAKPHRRRLWWAAVRRLQRVFGTHQARGGGEGSPRLSGGGSGCNETDTFGAASIVLAEYDLADQAYSLNKTAAQLAKRVAAEFSSQRTRFVAGWTHDELPTLGHIDYDTIKASFREQATGLYDGGVDLFIVETCQDVLQIKQR